MNKLTLTENRHLKMNTYWNLKIIWNWKWKLFFILIMVVFGNTLASYQKKMEQKLNPPPLTPPLPLFSETFFNPLPFSKFLKMLSPPFIKGRGCKLCDTTFLNGSLRMSPSLNPSIVGSKKIWHFSHKYSRVKRTSKYVESLGFIERKDTLKGAVTF